MREISILDVAATRGPSLRVALGQDQNHRVPGSYPLQRREGRKDWLRIYLSFFLWINAVDEVVHINQLHSQLPAVTTNLLTLPERTFLWSGAVLWSPLPPPQHGDWTRQDQSLSGQDRRRGLAQLPHREDGTVWKGHSGRTRQRFYRSRLVIKRKDSSNFLTHSAISPED